VTVERRAWVSHDHAITSRYVEVMLMPDDDNNVLSEHAELFANWRAIASVVWERWRTFVDADASSRAFAFASYVAALDAEEAAAKLIPGCLVLRAA
jgi:hypothetical protein